MHLASKCFVLGGGCQRRLDTHLLLGAPDKFPRMGQSSAEEQPAWRIRYAARNAIPPVARPDCHSHGPDGQNRTLTTHTVDNISEAPAGLGFCLSFKFIMAYGRVRKSRTLLWHVDEDSRKKYSEPVYADG